MVRGHHSHLPHSHTFIQVTIQATPYMPVNPHVNCYAKVRTAPQSPTPVVRVVAVNYHH